MCLNCLDRKSHLLNNEYNRSFVLFSILLFGSSSSVTLVAVKRPQKKKKNQTEVIKHYSFLSSAVLQYGILDNFENPIYDTMGIYA